MTSDISKFLQKLLGHLKIAAISTFFLPSLVALFAKFDLKLNDSQSVKA